MRIIATISLLLASLLASTAQAADANAGQGVAAICAACHSSGGEPGVSAVDTFPNLAGQKEGYLLKQLKAFKSGDRVDATMQGMVASLSEQDMENVAAYFAAQK